MATPRQRGLAATSTANLAATRRGFDMPTIEALVELRIALKELQRAAKRLELADRSGSAAGIGYSRKLVLGAERRVAYARAELDELLLPREVAPAAEERSG